MAAHSDPTPRLYPDRRRGMARARAPRRRTRGRTCAGGRAMTHQQPRGPRPGPGGVAEPCGHRRSVTVPGGPLVVAGVSGSPGSVHALRYAADLARRHGAALVPVLAWVPPGGDLLEHKYPDPELRRLWKQDACQRLRGWAFRHRGLDHRSSQTLWGSPDKTTGQANCN